jgi:hypothetical protein
MKRKIRDFYLIIQIFASLFLNRDSKYALAVDYLYSKKVESSQ